MESNGSPDLLPHLQPRLHKDILIFDAVNAVNYRGQYLCGPTIRGPSAMAT